MTLLFTSCHVGAITPGGTVVEGTAGNTGLLDHLISFSETQSIYRFPAVRYPRIRAWIKEVQPALTTARKRRISDITK